MAKSVNRKRLPIPNAELSEREKAWIAVMESWSRFYERLTANPVGIGADEDMLDLRDNDDPRITVTVIPTVMPDPKRWNGKR